ncbi:MAG: cysteine-rich CWC family protein [Gammaproteobacteria bacterium]|nr:cysteine-rich CWC family protein [Gammaproteobacteria bacterium]
MCQHCGAGFECKAGSILLCQCIGVELTSIQREYITQRYDDCLCRDCLVALRAEYNAKQYSNRINSVVAQR